MKKNKRQASEAVAFTNLLLYISIMITKNESTNIVVWDEKYSTGIDDIDDQHKQLVFLTNELYQACLNGKNAVGPVFKDAMSQMVEYVRFHFKTEQDLLKQMNYPYYKDHAVQHNELIKHIIEASNEFVQGKRFVANKFVITLKDWVFGHIAYYDKIYVSYFDGQARKAGLEKNIPNHY